jgi:ABC-2 type transport system ATP-binding protein
MDEKLAVRMVGLGKSFGPTVALRDVNLTIGRGEVFGYLGPNGAGKTTSIKMMVGLLQPSAGAVRVCGYDVVRQPRRASACVGYVPDEPYLYDKLTGRELLEFIADVYGMDLCDAQRRIDREIERFQLADFIDDRTESYSHGMKQRMVFATAMLHDPPVLVVDEPMVGLDPHSIRLVKELLRGYAAAGATVFMSTHTLSVAEEIADHIGILQHGRLVFFGTVDELRSRSDRAQRGLEPLYLELLDGQTPWAERMQPSAAGREAHDAAQRRDVGEGA